MRNSHSARRAEDLFGILEMKLNILFKEAKVENALNSIP